MKLIGKLGKSKLQVKAVCGKISNKSWDNLEIDVLHKLVERLPRICEAIVKSRGGYINEKTLK